MADKLFVLLLTAFPLMGSPGPVTMSLAGLGTAFGFRPGLRYLLGVMLGATVVLLVIAAGVTSVVLAHPVLLVALTGLAGGYILYLAWKIATAPVGKIATRMQRAPAFVPGFSLAIANPKAFAAIGAVYSSHTIIVSNLMLDTVCKLAALTGVIVVSQAAWLACGATLAKFLTSPRVGRAMNIIFATMLVASVGVAWLMHG